MRPGVSTPPAFPYTWSSREPPRGVARIGRAPVSKTGGWGFESLPPLPAFVRGYDLEELMNREMRRMQEREERLQKKNESGRDKASRRAAAIPGQAGRQRAQVTLGPVA